MAQTRNKRKNRSKKLNSTIICDKCKKICTRLQQHLNQNNSCRRHYNDIKDNNINANESSKRRSTRIKENTNNSVANLDIQIDKLNEKMTQPFHLLNQMFLKSMMIQILLYKIIMYCIKIHAT